MSKAVKAPSENDLKSAQQIESLVAASAAGPARTAAVAQAIIENRTSQATTDLISNIVAGVANSSSMLTMLSSIAAIETRLQLLETATASAAPPKRAINTKGAAAAAAADGAPPAAGAKAKSIKPTGTQPTNALLYFRMVMRYEEDVRAEYDTQIASLIASSEAKTIAAKTVYDGVAADLKANPSSEATQTYYYKVAEAVWKVLSEAEKAEWKNKFKKYQQEAAQNQPLTSLEVDAPAASAITPVESLLDE